MFHKGDTFWAGGVTEGVDGHLCVILSDPAIDPEQVVIVTVTTWEEYKDDSCMLEPGEHPFVWHLSCIDYRGLAFPVPVQKLEAMQEKDSIKPREPLTPHVLHRVLEGAGESPFLPNLFHKILLEQDLID
ncbi:MAG: hypothetical protein ACLFV7_04800 [Phycisphaerae bacterium]